MEDNQNKGDLGVSVLATKSLAADLAKSKQSKNLLGDIRKETRRINNVLKTWKLEDINKLELKLSRDADRFSKLKSKVQKKTTKKKEDSGLDLSKLRKAKEEEAKKPGEEEKSLTERERALEKERAERYGQLRDKDIPIDEARKRAYEDTKRAEKYRTPEPEKPLGAEPGFEIPKEIKSSEGFLSLKNIKSILNPKNIAGGVATLGIQYALDSVVEAVQNKYLESQGEDLSKKIQSLPTDKRNKAIENLQKTISQEKDWQSSPLGMISEFIGGGQSQRKLKIASTALGKLQTPKMAEGGIVTKPTLAMIGEGGEKEYIVPQSKLQDFVGTQSSNSDSLRTSARTILGVVNNFISQFGSGSGDITRMVGGDILRMERIFGRERFVLPVFTRGEGSFDKIVGDTFKDLVKGRKIGGGLSQQLYDSIGRLFVNLDQFMSDLEEAVQQGLAIGGGAGLGGGPDGGDTTTDGSVAMGGIKPLGAVSGGKIQGLSDEDYKYLAYIISGEAQGPDDDYMVAASAINRLASGSYGRTIKSVALTPGAYEAIDKGGARFSPDIENKLKSQQGQAKLVAALERLQGRTDYKGQSELSNRVASEDPMVNPRGNFFHYNWQTGPNSKPPSGWHQPNWKRFVAQSNMVEGEQQAQTTPTTAPTITTITPQQRVQQRGPYGKNLYGYANGQVQYITGDTSQRDNYRSDHAGGNYHDHVGFRDHATALRAFDFFKKDGFFVYEMLGRTSLSSGHQSAGDPHALGLAFDVPAGQNNWPVGRENLGSAKVRAELAKFLGMPAPPDSGNIEDQTQTPSGTTTATGSANASRILSRISAVRQSLRSQDVSGVSRLWTNNKMIPLNKKGTGDLQKNLQSNATTTGTIAVQPIVVQQTQPQPQPQNVIQQAYGNTGLAPININWTPIVQSTPRF